MREAERNGGTPVLPGPISGYGGGTWNTDGSVATLPVEPVAQARSARRQAAGEEYDPTAAIRSEDGRAALADAPRLSDAGEAAAINPRVRAMLGDAPKVDGPKSYFAGTGKFGVRDALMVLAAMGDKDGSTAADLRDMRTKGIAAREKAQAAYRQAQQVAALPGMNEREFAAYMANPDQWASHMADAMSSHHSAVNLGQTETRVFGDPTNGGHTYQPPRLVENGVDQLRYDPETGQSSIAVQGMTDAEQYARSLGAEPGTQEWANAIRDAELKANGPTAYRQRTQLEGQRQRGRIDLRQAPTYRDNNPLPPRAATPRGAPRTGGSRTSIPTISTPEEARRLPKGTKFKTPDGRVKVAG